MQKFLALMAIVFCAVLAIWVAFRLAPETWAVIAGLVFGLIATLPMCGIVILMIVRGNGSRRQPEQPVAAMPQYPAQQPYIVLNADNGFGDYMAAQIQPQSRVQMPQSYDYAPAGHSVEPRAYFDRTNGANAPFGPRPTYHWVDEQGQPQQPRDQRQPATSGRGGSPRILGE